MKKTKTIFLIALIVLGTTACTKSAADVIKGTYVGIETAGGNWDTAATCVVQKLEDNLVYITCTPVASTWSVLTYDNVSVTGTGPYTLTKTGPTGADSLSGSVNGNTITWAVPGVTGSFSFTGTK